MRATSFRDGFHDLPSHFGDLPFACVYHLLGKIRKAPDCALWDDETLAFLRQLDQHLRGPGNLSAALHDSHLLFLGLGRLDKDMMTAIQSGIIMFKQKGARLKRILRIGIQAPTLAAIQMQVVLAHTRQRNATRFRGG